MALTVTPVPPPLLQDQSHGLGHGRLTEIRRVAPNVDAQIRASRRLGRKLLHRLFTEGRERSRPIAE